MNTARWWATIPELAEHIKVLLSEGDESSALRVMLDGVNSLEAALEAGSLEETTAEPDSVGNLRWDTLLAAVVRYRLHKLGHTPPAWTRKEPLPAFWWPVRVNPSKSINDLVHTPAELLRVGIFMDERGLSQA